jgi:hypothetical protein
MRIAPTFKNHLEDERLSWSAKHTCSQIICMSIEPSQFSLKQSDIDELIKYGYLEEVKE